MNLNKMVSQIMIVVLLVGMSTSALNIHPVRAQGTVYIRADGSIDPSGSPISTVDNVTYTLTDNITSDVDGIVVERSNIIVNGSGYTVQGSGDGTGFNLTGMINATIMNTNIRNFSVAISLSSSNFSTINGNNITDNDYCGIRLISSNNTVSGNNITANDRNGFGILAHPSSSNNTVSGNNITNTWTGIELEGSSNNVSGNNIKDNNSGIRLISSNNSVSGNNITANDRNGISLDGCSGNSITGNVFVDDGLFANYNPYGNVVVDNSVNGKPLVYLEGVSGVAVEEDAGQVILVNCNGITVEGLNLSHTFIGIELLNTNNTKISSNNITNNRGGIALCGSSSNNTVSSNNIAASYSLPIALLDYSADNKIYHNNFNDINPAWSTSLVNIWDDGYPSGGNYWSGYSGNDTFSGQYQNETGSDGIGDTRKTIPGSFGNNQDRYPLMNPYVPPDIAVINTMVSKTIIGRGSILQMNITFENQGNKVEAFNVTVQADMFNVTSENNLLTSGNFTSVAFEWDTTSFSYGNYTLSAHVPPIPDEIDTSDNDLTCGWIIVTIPGDVNGDGYVEMMDFYAAGQAFNSKPGDLNWNPNVDIYPPPYGDNHVEMMDFFIMSQHYGEHW
jgi:parallel beta-helix repeat protein